MTKYKKIHQAFMDLRAGLDRASEFYSEMKNTVESLSKNVEAFVNNRRSEGSQLLGTIENSKSVGADAQADREQARLKDLMNRMSINPSTSPGLPPQTQNRPAPLSSTPSYQSSYISNHSPQVTPRYGQQPASNGQYGMPSPHNQGGYGQPPTNGSYQAPTQRESYGNQSRDNYNPNTYGQISPPAHQQYFSPPPNGQQANYSQRQQYSGSNPPYPQNVPQGYVPPPPPPGPPPGQHDYGAQMGGAYPAGQGGYAQDPRRSGQGQQKPAQGDPWAGLNAWK